MTPLGVPRDPAGVSNVGSSCSPRACARDLSPELPAISTVCVYTQKRVFVYTYKRECVRALVRRDLGVCDTRRPVRVRSCARVDLGVPLFRFPDANSTEIGFVHRRIGQPAGAGKRPGKGRNKEAISRRLVGRPTLPPMGVGGHRSWSSFVYSALVFVKTKRQLLY